MRQTRVGISYGRLFGAVCAVVLVVSGVGLGIDADKARMFVGQDLRLSGADLASFQIPTGADPNGSFEHILVFQSGCEVVIGSNTFVTDRAAFILEPVSAEFRGQQRTFYDVRAYLEGEVNSEYAANPLTSGVSEIEPDGGMALVLRFSVMGEVFVTAGKMESADVRGLRFYGRAIAVLGQKYDEERPRRVQGGGATVVPEVLGPGVKVPKFRYPINIASAGGADAKIKSDKAADGTDIATVVGRFYLWQKKDDKGTMMELEADSAVIFYAQDQLKIEEGGSQSSDLLASGLVEGIYLRGNVQMREGERSIRADEMFYDFQRQKALASNAVLKTFDLTRGVPIYVRAVKLRQLAENRFVGEEVVVTTSEFHTPQISMEASKIAITDMTSIDESLPADANSSFNMVMTDAKFKIDGRTLLNIDKVQGGGSAGQIRENIPLKKAHLGYDKRWGASIETEWYLSRLLGVKESPGTESTLSLDYSGKRGPGAGLEVTYEKENHFGEVIGYVMKDHGEDRLSRLDARKDIEPPRDLRGRFGWKHRHFLPYDWQFTGEIAYFGDENFLEQYYRGEYNVGKDQETLAHMKRIENNWGLSFLGKGRLNDFFDVLEEGPTGEFHWTGQSFWDDTLTVYSDTQVSRFRQRIGNEHAIFMDENSFSFVSHRTEVDMPLQFGSMKVVPYGAQSFGMDSRAGFERSAIDGTNSGIMGDEHIWIAEGGIRLMPRPLWKVYPDVQSRMWDLNQVRHIIKPHTTAVVYMESDSVVDQADAIDFGVSQLFQTKRGPDGFQETVDWLRFDADLVFVEDSGDAETSGPDRFIWNNPMVPLRVMAAPQIFNGDLGPGLAHYESYGPKRDYFSTDLVWRASQTSAILGDTYYDLKSGVIQQYNIGIARLVWPDLSFYVGNRYLKRTQILNEQGSNSLIFAATYVLDPRYTAVFSQQYDFDYGKSIRSDLTLIRRYHRLYMGLSFSADSSLDTSSVVLSFWPEGLGELALGSRRYMNVSSPSGY